jgi:hypothetical protein
MLRRFSIIVFLAAVTASWVTASQVWASALIAESRLEVFSSAIDGYPQLSFVLLTWVLIFWLIRYLKSVFTRFLVSAVLVLLFATLFPVWFDSASGSLTILSGQIAKKTGVSDWEGQRALLASSEFNHLSADVFVIAVVAAFLSLLLLIWLPKVKGENSSKFVTRIDNLPSW